MEGGFLIVFDFQMAVAIHGGLDSVSIVQAGAEDEKGGLVSGGNVPSNSRKRELLFLFLPSVYF